MTKVSKNQLMSKDGFKVLNKISFGFQFVRFRIIQNFLL